MNWFSGLFGDTETTNTNQQQTGFSQGNAWNDPRLQALISQIAGNTASLTGGTGFAPINSFMTGAASQQQGLNGALNPAFATANDIGSTGITPSSISSFQNPYQQQVVDAANREFNVSGDRAINQAGGNSARNLAYGNTNRLVGQQLAREGNERTRQSTISGIQQQGFNTAANLAGQSRGLQLQGANTAGQLTGAATGANAALGGLGQNIFSAQFQNAYTPQQLALQSAQTAGGLFNQAGTRTEGQSTGVSSSVATPSPFSVGMGGIGALMQFSDERMKDNIKPIGATFDGQPIYKYNMRGSPRTEIGLMAQDVEEHTPEAVGEVGGLKTVNYDRATKGAEKNHGGGIAGNSLHDKVRSASRMLADLRDENTARAKGGRVGYMDGGMPAVGASYDPSWSNTTVKPAGPDWSKLGNSLGKWGAGMQKPQQSGPSTTEKALSDSAASLDRFMGTMRTPGMSGGGDPMAPEAYEPLVIPRRTASAITSVGAGSRPSYMAEPLSDVDMAPRVPGVSNPGSMVDNDPIDTPYDTVKAPAVSSWSGRAPTGSPEGGSGGGNGFFPRLGGIWAGEKATPMQNFGMALMSTQSPRFKSPFNGMAEQGRALMDQRIKEQTLDRLMQQLMLEQRRVAIAEQKAPAEIEQAQASAALARTNADKAFLTDMEIRKNAAIKEAELAKQEAQWEMLQRLRKQMGADEGAQNPKPATRYNWTPIPKKPEGAPDGYAKPEAAAAKPVEAPAAPAKPADQPRTRGGLLYGSADYPYPSKERAGFGEYYRAPDGSIMRRGSIRVPDMPYRGAP